MVVERAWKASEVPSCFEPYFGNSNLDLACFFRAIQTLGSPEFILAFPKNIEAGGVGLGYDFDIAFAKCPTAIALVDDYIRLPFLQRMTWNGMIG